MPVLFMQNFDRNAQMIINARVMKNNRKSSKEGGLVVGNRTIKNVWIETDKIIAEMFLK